METQGFVNSQGTVSQGIVVNAEKVLKRYTAALAPLDVALREARAAEIALDAQDIRCRVKELRCDDQSGGLFIKRGDGTLSQVYGVTPHALSHYLESCGIPQVKRPTLEWFSPRTRALALYEVATRANDPEKTITLRTAMHTDGSRVIRAVVSELHSKETGDDLVLFNAIEAAVAGLGDTARARIIKTWDETDAEIVFPTRMVELKRDDHAMAALRLYNSSVKRGSFEAWGQFFRLVCTNGMLVPQTSAEVTVRHVGKIEHKIQIAASAAMLGLEDFTSDLRDAYGTPLPDGKTREEVLKVATNRLALPAVTVDAALHLWDSDGTLSAGNTVAGLAHAITRAAQGQSIGTARAMEEGAGRLVAEGLKVLGF